MSANQFDDRLEYVEAHQAALDFVIERVGDLLDDPDAIIVEKHGNDAPAVITNGAVTIDDLFDTEAEDFDEIDQEIGDQLVIGQNANQTTRAEIEFLSLLAFVSMHDDAETPQDEKIDFSNLENPEDAFLRFEKAKYRSLQFVHKKTGDTILMERFTLSGVQRWDEAERYNIRISDELVEKRISIHTIGDNIESVDVQTMAIEDPVLLRAIMVLEKDFVEVLTTIMTAERLSEEEVDEKLGDLWLRYQGTSKEDEVGPVLDELRNRIKAMQASKLFRTDTLTRPTADEITELVELLS